jgi:hypothetical protein
MHILCRIVVIEGLAVDIGRQNNFIIIVISQSADKRPVCFVTIYRKKFCEHSIVTVYF